jgi:dynein heavy chain
MCMSPVGDVLRIRCLKYPAMVDCCTLNWFSTWPSDALVSVAHTVIENMEDMPLPQGFDRAHVVTVLADLCKEMHLKAEL